MLQKRQMPKSMKNSYLTDFIKVAACKSSTSITPPDSKNSLEKSKSGMKKAPKSSSSAIKYTLPKSLHYTYDYDSFKNNKASVWHWNVNGINAVLSKGKLQEFFDRAKPDILTLNETKIDNEKLQQTGFQSYIPRSYHQYWNCCKVRKGYSGTALFSKVKPLRVEYDIGIQKHDAEGRSITAEFNDFILVAVYVPNAGENLKRIEYRVKEWDADFYDYICKLREEYKKPVILSGDLNVAHQDIDVFDPLILEETAGFTKEERESFSKFLKNGYVDTFRHLYPESQKFSFWNNQGFMRQGNRGWRIDYMVMHEEDLDLVVDSSIHDEFWGSDHCPINLKLDLDKSKVKKPEVVAKVDKKNEEEKNEKVFNEDDYI